MADRRCPLCHGDGWRYEPGKAGMVRCECHPKQDTPKTDDRKTAAAGKDAA